MEFLNEFKEQLVLTFTNQYFLCFFAGYLTGVIVCTFEKWFIRGNGKNG